MSYRARLDPIPLQPGTAKSGDHLLDLMVRFLNDMPTIVRSEVSRVMAVVESEGASRLGQCASAYAFFRIESVAGGYALRKGR
jgi:hypothetical protein